MLKLFYEQTGLIAFQIKHKRTIHKVDMCYLDVFLSSLNFYMI